MKKIHSILSSVALVIGVPMFFLGIITATENLFDGDLLRTLIGVGMFIGSSIFIGLGLLLDKIVEIWKATTTDSAKRKMHHKIYELLVNNGYDANVALDIATKIINIYRTR